MVKLQEANRIYQEQKYKQHHHPVNVLHTKHEIPTYLDTLAINTSEEEKDDNVVPVNYLDTLSSSGKSSTWSEYKNQLAKSPQHTVPTQEEIKMTNEQVDNERLQIMKNLLTWDDYKSLVSELQAKKNEVNGKNLSLHYTS